MGWSLNNWGSSRVEAASEFLRTGVVGTSFGGTGCFGSNQCAVGYACIGGRCVKTDEAGGGSGGSYSGSSNGAGGYYPGGSCGSGTDGGVSGDDSIGTGSCATSSSSSGGPLGCTVPTCGEGSNGYGGFDSDCCGTRCCRYQAGAGGVPTVNCYCGNCPGFTGDRCSSDADCASGVCINGRCANPKRCVSFCYEYYEANGTYAAGCSSDDICDECTECGGTSASGDYCTQKADAPPCHCDPGSVGDCDLCADDGSVIPGVCLECATTSNYDCGCGVALNVTVCQPQGTSGLSIVNKAQDAAQAACEEECAQPTAEPDKCAPSVTTKTVCAPGTCGDPGSGLPANEDGKNNVWTGCIEANGEACVLYNEEDYSGLPDKCKACDCNCHNDCPSCQLCGADGECYPDPTCEYLYFKEIAYGIFRKEEINSSAIGARCRLGTYIYDFPPRIFGTNSGKVGEADQGLSWVAGGEASYSAYSYSCSYPPQSGTWTELRVQKPDGTLLPRGPVTVGNPKVDTASQTVRYLYYDTGIVVGHGNTQLEAENDASAKFNAIT